MQPMLPLREQQVGNVKFESLVLVTLKAHAIREQTIPGIVVSGTISFPA